MAYYVGDIPSEDIVIDPARAGVAIDVTPFTGVTVVFSDPDGAVIPASGFTGTIDDDQVKIAWPATSVLPVAGMYALTVTLTGTGVREQLPPVYVIVQGDDGWVTLDSIREEWGDAPDDDRMLHELLEVAKDAVIAYAPKLADGQRPPTIYRKGESMHARNIWNAGEVNPSGQIGEGSYTIMPRPLDWQIKQILRPKRVPPVVA